MVTPNLKMTNQPNHQGRKIMLIRSAFSSQSIVYPCAAWVFGAYHSKSPAEKGLLGTPAIHSPYLILRGTFPAMVFYELICLPGM